MGEIVDTRGEGLRVGNYTFTVADVPTKGTWANGSVYYDFKFETVSDGQLKTHQELIPVWLAAPLLRALGVPEKEEGVFDFDKESVVGVQFDGSIEMEKNPKNGKEYRKLKNPRQIEQHAPKVEEEIPF